MTKAPTLSQKLRRLNHWITDRAIRAMLAVLRLLPFDARRALGARLVSGLVAPIAGYRARVRENLALVLPDLPEAEARRLTRAVPANIGRTLVELYSPEDLKARVRDEPFQGPGVPALEEAQRTGRGVLLVTGHIGNYDSLRAALIARGYRVGGLYKPMRNPFFNEHYVATISRIGQPLFSRTRQGMAAMVRFLRDGGMVGVVLDQHTSLGEPVMFMGRPAMTGLAVAEMALRYDALVLPCYGIRRTDGGFTLWFEAPVPHSNALTMTRALNDDLERQVRAHMDQWLWTHRRWKGQPPGAVPDDLDEEEAQ
ncbi:lysophospholipid acyltransferase family protein [Albidovulum sediminicola]|uniref:Lauroyl acyltransferase n=1 Tax=Albidovulum sediminicola TaxID=2984331 RepID=A0ABT2YWY9_9RHOB|nr:lauroyl acyltransferase [Defluviimonas sp. WL0075]MCV2863393.1 lauroyl acyltransferase [Defluviimonas sp. WL0075]